MFGFYDLYSKKKYQNCSKKNDSVHDNSENKKENLYLCV